MSKLGAIVFSFAAFAVLAGQTASAQGTTTLKIGSILDLQHPVIMGAKRMAEIAEKESQGRLKVEVYPSSQLGQQREIWQSVQAGVIDGVVDATANLANFVPPFSALDLPYLAKTEADAFRMLESAVVAEELGKPAAAAGFHIVKYWEVTFRNIYTRSKVIESSADLKGLKVRVIPNPSFIALFRALGASPTPMAYGESYTAMQQGVIDGAENDVVTYLTSKHFEVARNLALTNHMMLISPFTMSEKTWQRLPEDLRTVMSKAATEAGQFIQQERASRNTKALSELKSLGVKVTEPDLKPFVEAGNKTYAEMEARIGKELVSRIASQIK